MAQFLKPYNLEFSSKMMNDIEGFYKILMNKINKAPRGKHGFDYPEDVIINDEDFKSQRRKKAYWCMYEETLEEIQ